MRTLWTRPVKAAPRVTLGRLLGAAEDDGITLDGQQLSIARALCGSNTESVYLWGGVGRGKTWLMDAYFGLLPSASTRRRHFHAFLDDVHHALNARAGRSAEALDSLSEGLDVLLLDEFHLHDVADAHLMNRWLPRALECGLRVLATSNYPPEALLPDPLFQHVAEPVIATLASRFTVLELTGGPDYRAETTQRRSDGWGPGATTPQVLRSIALPLGGGRSLSAGEGVEGELITTFRELCEAPLSVADYRAVAAHYGSWAIGDVPGLESVGREPLQRFALLVDVLCDERVDVCFISQAARPQAGTLVARLRDSDRMTSRLAMLAGRPFASSSVNT
ncbi:MULTISPECIES: cell division protein ZapE [Arthrobacter]|uniref:Cell division protein ZapE n=2 Tax=Arthrobacter TaxID=1663 RepID=A0ABU9KGG0_9MICC|nr:cell division protein ZapE [Arthrobacter sp. YJM1]MDP5225967.1 cell division protein ZapE [Arthrobacter sp. YJM1]